MGEPAVVVVADERGQLEGSVLAALVQDVVGKHPGEHAGSGVAGDRIADGVEQREVEDRGKPRDARIAGHEGRIVGGFRRDLAKHEEVRDTAGGSPLTHRRQEGLPETVVDVLRRVDPEPVDPVAVDPVAEDVDHALPDAGVLRHEVVEPREVAHLGALAGVGRVAAIVVVNGIVEPGRNLDGLLRVGHHRRVRVVRARESGEVLVGLVPAGHAQEAVIDGRTRGIALGGVRKFAPRAIRARGVGALLVVDDVGRVVGDDIEVDLHAAGMKRLDQLAHVRVPTEVGIDAGKVGDPVAVIAARDPGDHDRVGRQRVRVDALDRLVLVDRPQPDRGRAERLDVVEAIDQALQVTAVVEGLGGRVEARDVAVAFEPALVVGRIAVLESIGKHEIDDFVLGRTVPDAGGQGRVGPGDCGIDGRKQAEENEGRGETHRETPLCFVVAMQQCRRGGAPSRAVSARQDIREKPSGGLMHTYAFIANVCRRCVIAPPSLRSAS